MGALSGFEAESVVDLLHGGHLLHLIDDTLLSLIVQVPNDECLKSLIVAI